MAVNKIIYNGETLVDLTSDTVTADDLAAGVTATGADGKPVIGLLPKVTIDTELSTTRSCRLHGAVDYQYKSGPKQDHNGSAVQP